MADSIIKINVKTARTSFDKIKADVLSVGVFENAGKSSVIEKINKAMGGAISKIKKAGDFKGKSGSTALIYAGKEIAAQRVLLVGLGKSKDADINTFRQAASKAAFEAVKLKAKSLAILMDFDSKKFDGEKLAQAIAEGVHFGGYRYNEFVTSKENSKTKSLTATIIEENAVKNKKLAKGAKTGQLVGESQNFARTLSNRPGNILYPEKMAAEAKKMAATLPSLSCTVYSQAQLKQKKMGGILAIGAGSEHKPCMIVLKYKPRTAKNSTPIALVGKAITFDSGGISIKPSQGMSDMKMDMTGGAAVMATMGAIAKLKLPVEVYGIICAAENKPDACSCRPGDIVTTYSGKTVEILNTDAEGRMVLCDGIHLANTLNCKTIIDIATLTGACAVALGKHKAGLMGNDDKLIEKLKQASKNSDEPVWHLPCGDEYAEEIKGKISDLKNIGSSRYGGACTAAAFLGQFAGKAKWAHIDIAGPMDASDALKKITEAGSIGFGTRLFVSYLKNLVKN